MKPLAACVRWVGPRQPRRPWLAQIELDDGRVVETLRSEHETEALALDAARKEIARRAELEAAAGKRKRWRMVKPGRHA